MKTWAVQDAKARFSELLRAAGETPQRITLHGKDAAVLLSSAAYRELQAQKENKRAFYEAWAAAPKVPTFEPASRDGGNAQRDSEVDFSDPLFGAD